jgi:hypothetical protein
MTLPVLRFLLFGVTADKDLNIKRQCARVGQVLYANSPRNYSPKTPAAPVRRDNIAAKIFKWHVFCLIGNSPAQWHEPLPARRACITKITSSKLHHQNCNIDIATAVVMIRILMAWWPRQL